MARETWMNVRMTVEGRDRFTVLASERGVDRSLFVRTILSEALSDKALMKRVDDRLRGLGAL